MARHHRAVPMQKTNALAVLATLALTACGGEPALLQSPDGSLRVVALEDCNEADVGTKLAAILAKHDRINAVIVEGHESARAAVAAIAARNVGDAACAVLALGGDAGAQQQLLANGTITAWVEDATGAAAALELAVIAHAGGEAPSRLSVGPRSFGKGSATPSRTPSAGDVVLTMLRNQHANALTGTSPLRIGVALRETASERGRALRSDVAEWSAAHTTIAVVVVDAEGDAARQRAQIAELLAQKCDALIVSSNAFADVADACRTANAQGIEVVALGGEPQDASIARFVNADASAAGRALASEVRRALPGGGSIALLRNPSRQRADAWAALVSSLQLAQPQ